MRRTLQSLGLLTIALTAIACTQISPESLSTATPTPFGQDTADDAGQDIEPLVDWGVQGDADDAAQPVPEERSDDDAPPEQPAPPPARTRSESPHPPLTTCPIAIAGWTARDMRLSELPDNVNKSLGIGTEYAVDAVVEISNMSDAPITINSLMVATTVTTTRTTFDTTMYVDSTVVQAGETKEHSVRSPLTIGVSDTGSIVSYGIDAAQRQVLFGLEGTFDATCKTWGFPLQYVPTR